jgi:hypothetical protein
VRALRVCVVVVIIACRRPPICPVPVERSRFLLFQDMVQPPCLAKKRMQLCNLGLFVSVAVYLEGGLRLENVDMLVMEEKTREMETHLAILVRLANVEERASAALVLFTAYDRVHRTRRAVEGNRGTDLTPCRFGLRGVM